MAVHMAMLAATDDGDQCRSAHHATATATPTPSAVQPAASTGSPTAIPARRPRLTGLLAYQPLAAKSAAEYDWSVAIHRPGQARSPPTATAARAYRAAPPASRAASP